MKTKTQKPKSQNLVDQNPIEILKGIGSGVVDSVVDDFGKRSINNLWEQLLGTKNPQEEGDQTSGDLEEGREIHLKKLGKSESREHAAPAINYHHEIVEVEKRATSENQREIRSKIQEIQVELDNISKASTEVAMQFKQIEVEQRIEAPGEYHVTFLQGLLNFARKIFMEVKDSGTWLNVMKSKKGQKNYWAMFKKHGTTFGLSNERVVATQAG